MKYGWLRSNFLKGRLWGEKKTLKGPNNIKKLGYCYKYWILNDHNDLVVTMSFIV